MRALLELETQSQHRVVSDRMSGGGDIGGGRKGVYMLSKQDERGLCGIGEIMYRTVRKERDTTQVDKRAEGRRQ